MAGENSKVGRVFSPASPISQTAARSAGLELDPTQWDANQYRKPDYIVYLYTVSDREFTVSQPPLISRLIIAPRAKGELFSLVGGMPSPFNQMDREGGVGDLISRAHIAERVAMSICNPNNHSLDQDAKIAEGSTLGLGVDLNAQGVWWSRNNPPTEEEISKAESRKERYYRGLIERARTLEISNPKELEFLINQDYHLAAEYFNIETSWHKHHVAKESCPFCGDMVKVGVAVHTGESGCGAVLDWDKAIAAGLKKESERPDNITRRSTVSSTPATE